MEVVGGEKTPTAPRSRAAGTHRKGEKRWWLVRGIRFMFSMFCSGYYHPWTGNFVLSHQVQWDGVAAFEDLSVDPCWQVRHPISICWSDSSCVFFIRAMQLNSWDSEDHWYWRDSDSNNTYILLIDTGGTPRLPSIFHGDWQTFDLC